MSETEQFLYEVESTDAEIALADLETLWEGQLEKDLAAMSAELQTACKATEGHADIPSNSEEIATYFKDAAAEWLGDFE